MYHVLRHGDWYFSGRDTFGFNTMVQRRDEAVRFTDRTEAEKTILEFGLEHMAIMDIKEPQERRWSFKDEAGAT